MVSYSFKNGFQKVKIKTIYLNNCFVPNHNANKFKITIYYLTLY